MHNYFITSATRIFTDKIARVMQTKLTLTLDGNIIQKAKKYAYTKGRSLSELIETYLKTVVGNEPGDDNVLSPAVKSLMGTFKAPKDIDYKKIIKEEKMKRHG